MSQRWMAHPVHHDRLRWIIDGLVFACCLLAIILVIGLLGPAA